MSTHHDACALILCTLIKNKNTNTEMKSICIQIQWLSLFIVTGMCMNETGDCGFYAQKRE